MFHSLRAATPTVTFRSSARFFHASAGRNDLVAPPDPVSHMRPIIYEDTLTGNENENATSNSSVPTLVRHPYSLSEFSDEAGSDRVSNLELQLKLQRQQLDAFHHSFWYDSNTRFEAAKKAILSGLPSTATTLDKENALSEFYKLWTTQEKARTDSYTSEWRRRNVSLILLDTRVRCQRFMSRISRPFS